ncbi:MAG: CPBP family intramembrane glutamic endopeptidase [Halobacteriota archaeon]
MSRVVALFWNRRERRLRAPWRLLLTGTLLVGIGLVLALVLYELLSLAEVAATGPTLTTATAGGIAVTAILVPTIATVVVVALAGAVLDRRRFSDFGFRLSRDWWVDLGFGLALGAGLMTLIFLVELAAGWVRVTGFFAARTGPLLPSLGLSLLLFLSVGFYEELLARGYILTNVAEGLVGWVSQTAAVAGAVVVSSAVFGVLHANNPNATLLSTLTIGFAGVFLAAGYVLTGELAIPIGVHITWNLFQGTVYGFPVSGNAFSTSIIATEQAGPRVVTGGQFGPEAGLLGVVAIALGVGLTVAWVEWRYGVAKLDSEVTTPDLRWL